jgi:hypothetical protein
VIYAWLSLSGVFCLSDIPLPDPDGKDNSYNRSRRLAYQKGTTKWVKIQPNKALGAYEIIETKTKIAEPVWPEEPETVEKAIEIALGDKLIDSDDHPVLKRFRGEL